MFRGSADFTVEKRKNELNTLRPYLFDLRGTGSLQGILNTDFHIEYSTDGFLRQTEIFWDGTMDISCTSSNPTPDDVRASLSANNRITITYKGLTDEWTYTPPRRFM